MMNSTEALYHAISLGLCSSSRPGPGGIILRCGAEVREALQGLTSDEVSRLRPIFAPPVKRRWASKGRWSLD